MHGKPEDLVNYSIDDMEFDETKPLGRFNKFRQNMNIRHAFYSTKRIMEMAKMIQD
jgi:hypothetical protein